MRRNNTMRQFNEQYSMRIILKYNKYKSVSYRLESPKWLYIQKWRKLNALYFVHKMNNGKASEYLTEQLKYGRDAQLYNLRNMDHFRIERVSTTAMLKSLSYKGL